MRNHIEWSAPATAPARADVLRLQGLPADREVRPRIAALAEAARAEYLELAEPRALVEDLSPRDFARIHRGEGRNAERTPLELVASQAEALALFVATVGERLTARIRELFAENQPALGSMLDAVASAAVDRLPERIASRHLPIEATRAGPARVLAYSPGYCGWDLTGQRALFASLRPEAIGVTLNASCLMRPLKSVSGVLVIGPGRIHRFAPKYPFCAECAEKPCRARIAAVLGEEP